MELSFTKKVKLEIKKHLENNVSINLMRVSFDALEMKKDLRYKFLKHGTINRPESGHHLELSFDKLKDANDTIKELLQYGIVGKLCIKNSNDKFLVYIVDKNNILKYLKLLGANKSYKEYKHIIDINTNKKRIQSFVNFETANIKKMAVASTKQMMDIELLLKKYKINDLDAKLKELIEKRESDPYCSMQELADKLKISKSAVNHRFMKIRELIRG